MASWGPVDPRNRAPDEIAWSDSALSVPPEAETETASQVFDDDPPRPGVILPLCLFALTVFTTLWAGAYQTSTNPRLGPVDFLAQDPWALLRGLPFAATLLLILVTHECGHFLLSRIHRVPATLPLFIPGPPHFIGTFGAIIRMRPILNRKALFDIGVAGPIAGFVVAVGAMGVGLALSTVTSRDSTYGLQLGEPLLLQFMSWLVIGPIPERADILLHPIAFAAWFGLFVTSLNLIPIGQLDGGHVAYALWGRHQRNIALIAVPILLVLGFVGWPGWFLWVGMASLLGVSHPPIIDPHQELGRVRIWIGWAALVMFVLSFAPIPFSVG